jgi:hypothetical protein
LENVETGELVPIIGGDCTFFHQQFGKFHEDLKHADLGRLAQFDGKGWY